MQLGGDEDEFGVGYVEATRPEAVGTAPSSLSLSLCLLIGWGIDTEMGRPRRDDRWVQAMVARYRSEGWLGI